MHFKHTSRDASAAGPLTTLNAEVLRYYTGSDGKECASNAGDLGSITGSGRSPGEGNDYPLQYS